MKEEKNKRNNHSSDDYQDVIQVKEENHRVVIVSDLHLSGGQYSENGKYRATENFFYDEEFANFLKYLEENQNENPWKLIINGDFIDFIRLTECPNPDEYPYWQTILKDVGIHMDIKDFKVSKREQKFGLKTHEYKSIWKMDFVGNAHSIFFNALAEFIEKGNRLVVVKGNHDVEFYWEKVRLKFNYLILNRLNISPVDPKAKDILERIEFCNRSYVLEKKIYVEHGHQYEKITSIKEPILGKGENDELVLPYGSFINRYFLNKVEHVAPFMNNIKPPTAYIDALFKSYPIHSIKLLFKYIPLTWKVLKKKYYWETMKLVRKIIKYSMIPLSIILLVVLPSIVPQFKAWLSSIPFMGKYLADIKVGGVISLFFVALPFVLPALFRKDHIKPALSKIKQEFPGLAYVVFGHFHSPDKQKFEQSSYINTGTWIPIIELQEKLKTTTQFCLLLIDKKKNGDFKEPLLKQWNNCSGRLEKIILIEKRAP